MSELKDLSPGAVGETEERLQLFVDHVRDYAMFVMDPAGTIGSWNAGVQRLLGYPESDFIGRPFSIIFPSDDAAAGTPQKQLALAAATGRSEDERWHLRKDGVGFWARGMVTALRDDAGRLRGFATIVRDITERKLAEEERAQLLLREHVARQDAETANRLRDQFLATVSHELRTPLATIIGWTDLMLSQTLPAEVAERALHSIDRNARLQAHLIDNVLELPRLMAGRVALALRPVDLRSAIQEAVDSMTMAARDRGLTIDLHADALDGCVAGDPSRLQQILRNLLDNAIKFTPSGGSVVVEGSQAETFALITVRDTGEGMDPDFLPHVFEPFRQADGRIRRTQGGLGLAIVRQLVESHQGTVTADSDGPGCGSLFTVRLPLMPTKGSWVGPPTEIAPVSLSGLRVLVIEDDPDSREVAVAVLELAGAIAIGVESAADGLAAVTRERPHVIVCDLGMPREDGFEFIRRLRARSPDEGGRLPTIALTAYARPEDRLHVVAAGFQTHLSKPFDIRALRAAVAEVCGSEPLD